MATSPSANSDGPFRATVKAGGKTIPDTVQLLSARVFKAVNRVPRAEIVLRDGDMSSGEFAVSESDSYKPGAAISIEAGYGDSTALVFSGIVIGQQLAIGGDNLCTVTLECRDKSAALTVGRKNANYVDKKDSDIAGKLIGAVSGLTAQATATATQWKELVQYYCTDWDFLLARAEANGYVVIADDATVSFAAPKTDAAAALTVTYGSDLLEFQAKLDARDQFASVQATAWDIKNQKIAQAKATPATVNAQGDLAAADLARALNIGTFGLQTAVTLESADLTTWAKAQQLKSGLARIRGSMKFQGSALAKVGAIIEVAGVGKRFNGKVYVSGITHEIGDGAWFTRAEFGLPPAWYAESGDLEAPAAAGLVPGVEGLQIGVVKKLSADPDGQFKIQVSIPVMQAETDGVWARLMQFHATSGQGAFFVPEVGDEVVLGYFNNDPSAPVILGSLYSSKRKTRYPIADEKNNTKAITTRSGLTIEYDDDKKVITVVTPGKNKIVISDDDKSILLQDQHDNKLKMNDGGISLDSPKDITLKAQGNISLTATGKVQIKATQDATMDGLNVTHTAQIGFTGKGSATAELSASGQTTVKGAMVMIN